MSRKITIKFSDDNGDPSGGASSSDNTGYRIYRAVGSDPSNTLGNKIYDSQDSGNPPPQGTGEITFEDTDVQFNTPYYYRVENFRTKSGGGEDTALSPPVGPILIQDLEQRLGYPNNIPSNTDGLSSYNISVEPLIHFDATQELKKHGLDYNYGTQFTVENLSSNFSGASMKFLGGGVYLGVDGETPELRAHDTTSSGSISGSIMDGPLFNQQIKDKLNLDPHDESRIILDNGVCFFYIAPSVYNHPFFNTENKENQLWSRASGLFFRNVYGCRKGVVHSITGSDKNVLKNHLSTQYSDSQIWSDPDPWGDSVNPEDPAWIPEGSNHLRAFQTLFGFAISGAALEVNPNLGDWNSSNSWSVQYGYNYMPLTYVYRYGNTISGKSSSVDTSKYPDLTHYEWSDTDSKYTDSKINVICKRIYPDGKFDFFINGVKAFSTKQIMFKTTHSSPMPIPEDHIHKSYFYDAGGTSNTFSNTLPNTWWYLNPRDPKATRINNADAYTETTLYKPLRSWPSTYTQNLVTKPTPANYLLMMHPPAFGLNREAQTGYNKESYWEYLSGYRAFNEILLIPSDLTENSGEDFNTITQYIQDKYSAGNLAEQGDYADLPEQTITWSDNLSNLSEDFTFTASSDQNDATIVYTLSSNVLGTVSGNVFTPSNSASSTSVEVTATALATATHVQTSITKNLTLDQTDSNNNGIPDRIEIDPVATTNLYATEEESYYLAYGSGTPAYGIGKNSYKQLGVSYSQDERTRLAAGTFYQYNHAQVAGGKEYSIFLNIHGHAYAAGKGYGMSVKQGYNRDGNAEFKRCYEHQSNGVHTPLENIIQIACGMHHTLFLNERGWVYAAGTNTDGKTGQGADLYPTRGHVDPAKRVWRSQNTRVYDAVYIAAGGRSSFYQTSSGNVYGFGSNSQGQLGISAGTTSTYTPIYIPAARKAVQISVGEYHTLFLFGDGTVKSVGANYNGQLGHGAHTISQTSTPGYVRDTDGWSIMQDVIGIAAGYNHSLFLKKDNSVWSVGLNYHGQLGDGTQTDRSVPVKVTGLTDKKIYNIAAGRFHSLFATAANSDPWTVYGCGNNTYGELGTANKSIHKTPVDTGLTTPHIGLDSYFEKQLGTPLTRTPEDDYRNGVPSIFD